MSSRFPALRFLTSTRPLSHHEENFPASELFLFLSRDLGNLFASIVLPALSYQIVPVPVPGIRRPTFRVSLAIPSRPASPFWLPPARQEYRPAILFREARTSRLNSEA